MNIDVFTSRLDEIYKSHEGDHVNSDRTPKETLALLADELTNYKKFIPDFFSHNGAANNIKYIYAIVGKNENPDATITCIDTIRASDIYNEYNRGMVDFVTEVIADANYNCDNIDKHGKFRDSLERANTRDKEFIDSIFGGEHNKAEEKSLSDALLNIEVLIDFIHRIDDTIKRATDVVNGVENPNSSELINQSIHLLYRSIVYYTYKMISTIINIYGMIDDAVKNESNTSAPVKFQLL
jgi:hypothetical protein